jgi:GxxExxY protein
MHADTLRRRFWDTRRREEREEDLHKEIGPGLLESVYEALLAASLGQKGIKLDRQKPIELRYAGLVFAEGFRADLILEDRLIIEVKSVDRLAPVHSKQMLTYLRLLNLPLGILMNFGGATFREGLKRVVHQHSDFASSRLRVHRAAPPTPTGPTE